MSFQEPIFYEYKHRRITKFSNPEPKPAAVAERRVRTSTARTAFLLQYSKGTPYNKIFAQDAALRTQDTLFLAGRRIVAVTTSGFQKSLSRRLLDPKHLVQ